MEIHSTPLRSYIDPDEGDRVWIRIIVILCAASKKDGRQYTKRILPDFLIPYSPIRLDRILEAELRKQEKEADLCECSLIMGCIDDRTVRKHLDRLKTTSDAACLSISERLSHTPQYASLPASDPGNTSCQHLELFIQATGEAASARGGSAYTLRQFLQTEWWHIFGKPSMSYVSQIARPP